jgi:hypothetical protein
MSKQVVHIVTNRLEGVKLHALSRVKSQLSDICSLIYIPQTGQEEIDQVFVA